MTCAICPDYLFCSLKNGNKSNPAEGIELFAKLRYPKNFVVCQISEKVTQDTICKIRTIYNNGNDDM